MRRVSDPNNEPMRGELELRFYSSNVDQVNVVVEGGTIPLQVGATFSCRVVAVTRRVEER